MLSYMNIIRSMHELILLYEHEYMSSLFLIFMRHAISFRVFSCRDAYDCKPDPAMAGLAIRLYEITIEASDAAGNIGRDQCRVIILPSNMTIQDMDAIVQKSIVRYPVAATADLGIMVETNTNIILRYMHDLSQGILNKIDSTQSTTSRALHRVERASTMLNDYMPTYSNMKQREKIEVEGVVGIFGFVLGILAGVGVGFVLGRIGRAG